MQAVWVFLALVQASHQEDFEERARLDLVHAGWERIRSAEHPAWNEIRVERDPREARSGERFLRMETQGGHTAFRQTAEAAWTIDPRRPYRFRGWAQLGGTRRNAARFALVWLDERLRPLREDRSEPVEETGLWVPRLIEVHAPPREARRVAVRLDFEGPDVRGECRFDQLSLEPAVLIRLASPGVFEPESLPRFGAEVFGLGPGEASVRAVSRTLNGAVVHRAAPRPASGPLVLQLPPHSPGVYGLEVTVEKGGLPQAEARAIFLVPAPWTAGPPAAPLCRVRIEPASPQAASLAGIAGAAPSEGPLPTTVLQVSKGDPAVRATDLLRTLVPLAGEALGTGSVLVVTDDAPAPIAALRTFHDLLSGAEARPELRPFPPEFHPHAFERDGRITLALWSERRVEREVHLGDGVRLHPPLGTPRVLAPGERVAFGPLPVFLSGIDPALLRLLGGFEIVDPVLPLQRAPLLREVRFREPATDLRIRLLDPLPAGWTVRPRDVDRELTILLPASAAEGSFDLVFEVSFVRDGRPLSFRAVRPVRVEPRIHLSAAPGPAVLVANRSGAARSLLLRIRAPGRAEETLPLALADGASRAVPIPAGAEVECEERGGDRLRAGLR